MISGLHTIIYSADADADRAFFRDVLGFPAVDAGHGWLIFAAPPSEIAFHPDAANGRHELYLMCDDLAATMRELEGKSVRCGAVSDESWGRLTSLRLPGGGELGLYEPRHPTALGLRAA